MTLPPLQSRLPDVGTTIFTVMSALAQQQGAVNLGQGFPDFDADPRLIDGVSAAMKAGHNQYPPMAGVPALRQAVSRKIASFYGVDYCPDTEITITAGATQALLTALLALVHPGDEVIVLEPCYDSYAPNIVLCGGTVVRVALHPETFAPDFDAITAAITPRTRAILVNSPHNPSGAVWSAEDWNQLAAVLEPTSIYLISDEVYEHMVYDGRAHFSAAQHSALRPRTIVVSSFGKTFHVTGWKVGTVTAPAALTTEFRKVHQFNVFTVNTPVQHALAAYLNDETPMRTLPSFYQAKRDRFRKGLSQTKFRLLPSPGTYFQVVDYSEISDRREDEFCRWLTTTVGVAAIPLSAFYADQRDQRLIRFCFAKRDDTLDTALARLASFAA